MIYDILVVINMLLVIVNTTNGNSVDALLNFMVVIFMVVQKMPTDES